MAFVSPRKVIKAKRAVQGTCPENSQLKTVTFKDETIETSIGGTQRVGKIKKDLLLHFDPAVNTKETSSTPANQLIGNTAAIKPDSTSSSGKENVFVPTDKKRKPNSTDSSQNAGTSFKDNSESHESPASSLRSVTGKSQPKVKLSKDKLDMILEKKEDNVTLRTRNSKDFLSTSVDLKDKSQNNISDAGSTCTSKSRRTTLECIDNVVLTPFQAPEGKYARRHTLESNLFSTSDCFRDASFGSSKLISYLPQDDPAESLGDGEDSCSVMVAVRVRPFCKRELADANVRCAVKMQDNETTVISDSGVTHRFVYDMSFWSHDQNFGEFCDQELVYQRLAQPLLGKAFEGYNTCLFAYGQTGSGKSYSIMGRPNDSGIIPRFCAELFSRAEALTTKKKVKVNVEISFFEIYNEKIHDLLASTKERGSKKTKLRVREHPVLGPYVEGLSTYVVNSYEDVEGWLTLGNKNRATAATDMNDKSSRSHSVFTIVMSQLKIDTTEGQEHDRCVSSKINLVDLAGSERQSTANTTGERLREGASINKSLLTLGKVISDLCDRSNKKVKKCIPYRESVLTWLLKESLGGNSKTAMIATISPSNHHIEETLSTLRYAQQARSIVNVVRINEDPKAKLIRQLRSEIEHLRAEHGGTVNDEALAASNSEIARLKYEMEELSRSLQERLREAETKKAEELRLMEKSGITLKVDTTMPNLVNLNKDPQLSEMLLYVIKEGETRVGRNVDDSGHDLKLTGALIADNHCVIKNVNGTVDITPVVDAPTYVNGNLVSNSTVLHHGDRVVLGRDHYFRFNHPMEVQKNDKEGRNSDKDFEFAKQELNKVKEASFQADLQIELEKSQQENLQIKNNYENKLKGLESALMQVNQTNREAESTISSLKKKNLILEKEVLDGRNKEKSEKSLENTAESGPCKLLLGLEEKVEQAKERLAYMRRKRDELNGILPANLTSRHVPVLGSPGSRKDLCQTAMLVREANIISQELKMNLLFSGEYLQADVNPQIRIVNTKHRLFTLWSLPKFEEKLALMRDRYQDDEGTDENDVFGDPEDMWEKESILSSPRLSSDGGSRLTSVDDIPGTPVSALRAGFKLCSPRLPEETEMSMVKTLKYILASTEEIIADTESPVDKMLLTCQRIQQNIRLVTSNVSVTSKKDGWSRPILRIVSDIQALDLFSTMWYRGTQCFSGVQSLLVQDLLDKLTDHAKSIKKLANSLMQGCESQLINLVSESGHKLTVALLSLSETCGQLALATGANILSLSQSQLDVFHSGLSIDIIKSFWSGCNKLATQFFEDCASTLEGLMNKCKEMCNTEDYDLKSDEMSRRLNNVLSCIEALVQKTSQEGLAQGMEWDDKRPLQFYAAAYRSLQKILPCMSSVVNSCKLLLVSAESLLHGSIHDSQRLKKCVEQILQLCHQLMPMLSVTYPQPTFSISLTQRHQSGSSCSSTSSLSMSSTSDTSQSMASSSSSSSDLTEVSLLSESQLSCLDSAVQEVTMAMSLFSEYLDKGWSSKTFTTPDVRKFTTLSVKPAFTPASSKQSLK